MPAHPVAMNTVATLPKDSNICTPPARALSATTSRDALRNTLRRSASAGPREVAFASHHPDHCSVHQRRTGKCGAGASDPEPLSEEGATCPPDTNGEPTTVGGGSSAPLSEKLARSKGVICPLPVLIGTCRSRRRAAVISRSFHRRAHRAEDPNVQPK